MAPVDAMHEILSRSSQLHLLEAAAHLSDADRQRFLAEIRSIDWDRVGRLFAALSAGTGGGESPAELVRRIQPPTELVRLPVASDAAAPADWQQARMAGEELLKSRKVAAIVVAGGQGTRLGFDHPKGMFPVGPLSQKTLFQLFCEQIRARSQRAGYDIPYAVMTSDATHDETVAYFRQHQNFGLAQDQVRFFKQGNMPAVETASGQALMSEPGRLALSPDGHGGLLAALESSGLLAEWGELGIETLYYHQVDNATSILCDPAFLGWHVLRGSEVSTKVVAKRSAEEKMGVAVSIDGRTQIIEYSDLPAEIAAQVDEAGRLRIWAGSTAIHAFQREFLERVVRDADSLPFHLGHKAVPHWHPEQGAATPDKPNAYKFERFIFDVLPLAQRALIVEADRAVEFNPVKNRDGHDSPDTARAALQALHRSWLRAAGAEVADDVPVEISPLVALEAGDLQGRGLAGKVIREPLYVAEWRIVSGE